MAEAAKAAAKPKIHRRMLPRARTTSHAKRTPDAAATGSDKPPKRPAPAVTKGLLFGDHGLCMTRFLGSFLVFYCSPPLNMQMSV